MAHNHDPLDLFRGSGQRHTLRSDAKIRQPVTLVGLQFFLRCDQAAVAGDGAELLENAGVHELLGLVRCFPGSGLLHKQPSASVLKRQSAVASRIASDVSGCHSWPKLLMSSGPALVATFASPWTMIRICSTISGLARVVTSPMSMAFEMELSTRRMILPERVLGMSGTIRTYFGRAILPITVSIARTTLSSMDLLGLRPGLSAM